MNIRLLTLFVLAAGCAVDHAAYTESNPQGLVGAWVLARSDGTWGDTTTWNADGSVRGSTGHPVPADARWVVRQGADGARRMCISGGNQSNCQPFLLVGDTLVWGAGSNVDRFRSVSPRR
jgi:hypothetical protein